MSKTEKRYRLAQLLWFVPALRHRAILLDPDVQAGLDLAIAEIEQLKRDLGIDV